MIHELPTFEIGRDYSRLGDLHAHFGGSRQSGISYSASHPVIFVFTGDSGEKYGYKDGFDEAGVFSYFGEGQVGDMTFRSGNKALRDHALNGKAVHLFKTLGKSRPVRYLGEFQVASYHIDRGPDREGKERGVIIFHMLRVGTAAQAPDLEDTAIVNTSDDGRSLGEARLRALEACSSESGNAGTRAVRTLYSRSQDVKRYVLLRESGKCRGCLRLAPFVNRQGQPYLECHHTNRLSDGGLDHPRYVVALCPNCHREVHIGENGNALNDRLRAWLNENEPPT
jgi:5-methylcytosine-specific restriction enzyme A